MVIREHPEYGIQSLRKKGEGYYEVDFNIKDGWLCMHFGTWYMEPIEYIGDFYDDE